MSEQLKRKKIHLINILWVLGG